MKRGVFDHGAWLNQPITQAVKLDILAIAPALLPLVPHAYKPLASALLEEVKARRAEAAKAAADLAALHQHIRDLTNTVNAHTVALSGLSH